MSANNTRRGLGHIKSPADARLAADELSQLVTAEGQGELDETTKKYLRGLAQVLDRYMKHCIADTLTAEPCQMLEYLLTEKSLTTEAVAQATGISDLRNVLLAERRPTAGEAQRLAGYFDVAPEAFQGLQPQLAALGSRECAPATCLPLAMPPTRGKISVVLAIICLASWFTPWGVVTATLIGLQKGTSVCAHPGCVKAAEIQVGYDSDGFRVAEKPTYHVGFCEDHGGHAPRFMVINSYFALVGRFFGFVLPIAFVVVYGFALSRIFRRRYKAFRDFCWLTAAGAVANLFAYVFWLYVA